MTLYALTARRILHRVTHAPWDRDHGVVAHAACGASLSGPALELHCAEGAGVVARRVVVEVTLCGCTSDPARASVDAK